MRWMMFAAAVLFGVQADGDTIYNDGGTHTVNTASPDITVTNGSSLIVQSGAVITGSSMGSAVTGGIAVSGTGSIDMTGGSVSGGNETVVGYAGGDGIFFQATGSVVISGGSATGGTSLGGLPNGVGLDLYDINGTGTISGGTFTGNRGLAVNAVTLMISGGTFQGQTQTQFFPIVNLGEGADIGLSEIHATATISGGDFIGGSGAPSLRLLEATGETTISGGTFDGPIELDLTVGTTVTFLGSGLQYLNGVLTGTLQDGTPINVSVGDVFAPFTASINPTQIVFTGGAVPEPASLVMMSLGLAGVGGLAWRRRLAA